MEVRETFGETETDVNQNRNYVNNSHSGRFVESWHQHKPAGIQGLCFSWSGKLSFYSLAFLRISLLMGINSVGTILLISWVNTDDKVTVPKVKQEVSILASYPTVGILRALYLLECLTTELIILPANKPTALTMSKCFSLLPSVWQTKVINFEHFILMASQIEIDVAMAVIIGETTIGRAFKNRLIFWAYFGYVLKQQCRNGRQRK